MIKINEILENGNETSGISIKDEVIKLAIQLSKFS